MFTELAPSKATASYSNEDAGLEWVTTATLPLLSKRALYKGRLGFFQAFAYSQSNALEDYDAQQKRHDELGAEFRQLEVQRPTGP